MEDEDYYDIAVKLADELISVGDFVVCNKCREIHRDGCTCICGNPSNDSIPIESWLAEHKLYI